jgi:probable phosphoglycerate mutase
MREHEFGEAEGCSGISTGSGSERHDDVPGAETTAQLTDRALASLARSTSRPADAPPAGGVRARVHARRRHPRPARARLGRHAPAPGERLGNGSVHRFAMDGGGLRLLDAADRTRLRGRRPARERRRA